MKNKLVVGIFFGLLITIILIVAGIIQKSHLSAEQVEITIAGSFVGGLLAGVIFGFLFRFTYNRKNPENEF